MKILLIQPWISYRGSETVSVLQAYYLNQLGHQAKIACLYADHDRLPPHGDEVEYLLPPKWLSWLFAHSPPFFFVFNLPVLFWLVLKTAADFDVLNPHNLPSVWVAAWAKSLKRKKLVWTAHGVPPQAGLARTRLNLILWYLGLSLLDQWTVGQADFVLAVSQRVAWEVKKRYGFKADVCPPPIDQEFYREGKGEKVRRRFGIKDDAFLLLHVSRVHPIKELALSIRTLAKVNQKIKDTHLLFVGGGKRKQPFLTLATKLGVGQKVHFAGFVKPINLKHYFAAADLNLVPYWRTEGCPVTPFQALMAGTISVVARGSGADEIINSEGIGLVAKPNQRAFTQAVLAFYRHRKSWEKVSQEGRIYVEKNLSGEAYAQKIVKTIREEEVF